MKKEEHNITYDDVIQFIEKPTNIIRNINDQLSIRNGKYGNYIYYKTQSMKKPKFLSLQGFKDKIEEAVEEDLLTWIEKSDFGNMSESTMIDSMFTNSMKIPKLNMPKLIMNDTGYTIESNNLYTSVGWRNKNELVWKIYIENKLIKPKDDFEIILFRPGYEVLIKAFKK